MRSARTDSRIIGAKAFHDVIAVHREGGDAALLVAGDALVLEDLRDRPPSI